MGSRQLCISAELSGTAGSVDVALLTALVTKTAGPQILNRQQSLHEYESQSRVEMIWFCLGVHWYGRVA